jgi:uncharacterized C2H2 Zn-finger protein
MVLFCPTCGAAAQTFQKFVKHLKRYHEFCAGFSVTCHLTGCKNKFRNVTSYVRHVEKCHWKCDLIRPNPNKVDKLSRNLVSEFEENETAADEHLLCQDGKVSPPAAPCDLSQLVSSVNSYLTGFVLCLREKHILTTSVTEEITRDVIEAISMVVTGYSDVIKSSLDKDDPTLSAKFQDVLNVETMCSLLGQNVTSEYRLLRHLRDSESLVEPVQMMLDDSEPAHTFQYVPILDVIKKIMSHDDVFDNVVLHPDHPAAGNKMRSFRDSDLFQADPFFDENPDALWINLYVDEFEVCNPIGAKKGKHKLTGVYYVLGNLSGPYRSQLRFIHLAMLVKYKYLTNGYNSLLQPLIRDLKTLYTDGVSIACGTIVKGKMITISADNLSAHALAGFQQNFTTGRVCRHCMIDVNDLASHTTEQNVTLRTEQLHNYHLQAVLSIPGNASIYGVKKPCPFTSLPNFEVCTAFPPDIMHDLLEGCMPTTVKLVLKHFVSAKLVSVTELNKTMENVDITNRCNKPNQFNQSSFRGKGSLAGTAAQKLELFLLLPRLIGHVVVTGDRTWAVYLLLREICDIILSPAVDKDNLNHLEELISLFLQTFVAAFPLKKLTPKFHFLIHYPRLMKQFGPLRNFWCMRFEGKHQYFKKVAAISNSFVNIAKTLAKRHQLRQCWEMKGEDLLVRSDGAETKTTMVSISTLPEDVQAILHSKFLKDSGDTPPMEVACCGKITLSHCSFKVNCVYVVDVEEEEQLPVFLQVKQILNVRQTWLLCGYLLFPLFFDNHYHSFVIDDDETWAIMTPANIIDHSAHDFYRQQDRKYISMRYNVVKV